jgi:hypothetical protein
VSTSRYRGNYLIIFFCGVQKAFFQYRNDYPNNIFHIFYLDDGIVNQLRQNEAGNRSPKVTSIPFGRILVV